MRAPMSIDLGVAPVPLQGLNPRRTNLGALEFVGGFHLTSTDSRFGGLSGLDLLEDGRLLAVSDAGDFVWIALGEDGVTPVSAGLAGMLDARGGPLRGKTEGDAEGLAVLGGAALVSFERDHRVLAFDLERCGAGARGVPVSDAASGLAPAFARQSLNVSGNEGVEALASIADGFILAGLETRSADASIVSARAIEGAPEFDIRLGTGAPPIVGVDILANDDGAGGFSAYSLHRSTNPLASEMIVLVETVFERELDQRNLPARVVSAIDERSRVRFRPVASRRLAAMNLLLSVDNFEGIAARRMTGGDIRLYLVSDNNFSASQRTLLMVFDLAERE